MFFVKTNMSKYKKNVSVKKDEMKISIITKKKSRNALNTKIYDKVWAPSMFKFERQLDGKSEPLCSEATANINRFLTPWACEVALQILFSTAASTVFPFTIYWRIGQQDWREQRALYISAQKICQEKRYGAVHILRNTGCGGGSSRFFYNIT